MNRRVVPIAALLIWLLAGCTQARGDIVFPQEYKLFSFSPHLDWVTYERDNALWLAQLPNLQEFPVLLDDAYGIWSTYTYWMPDGTGFLVNSNDLTNDTETWWLVKLDNLNTPLPLCTLPNRERIVVWSPTSTAFITIERGGGVTLVQADGSGCKDLPIPGLVIETPSISWSPDGEKISYVYIPYGELVSTNEMRVIDVNTHQETTIYTDTVGVPVWFPDGEEILLFGGGDVLPVIHADGSGLAGEVEIPDGYEVMLSRGSAWSPDGHQLALYLKTKGPNYEPVAVGILHQDTLTISVFEASYFSEILSWRSTGDAVVVLAYEDEGVALDKVSVRH